jgi:hypothetical protein
MSNILELVKNHRLSLAAIMCVVVAAVSFSVTNPTTNPVGTIAGGLLIGIASLGRMYRSHCACEKASRYPFVPTLTTLKALTLIGAVSAIAVIWADLIWIRLVGTLGYASWIGFLVGQLIISDDRPTS